MSEPEVVCSIIRHNCHSQQDATFLGMLASLLDESFTKTACCRDGLSCHTMIGLHLAYHSVQSIYHQRLRGVKRLVHKN